MRPQAWRAPLHRITTLLWGPEPVGAFTARSVDAASTRELTGLSGRSIRWGEKGTPARRFYGDLGPLQHFNGAAATMASLQSTNKRGAGEGRAFPSTKPTASVAHGQLENLYGPYGSDSGA